MNSSGWDKKGRLSLVFHAVVQDGEGAFSRMAFPGPDEINGAPADWPGPEKMQPGSLNCRVTKFPWNFRWAAGPGDRIQKLDSGRFTPEFTIPAEMIENNRLEPDDENPRRGTAQIWRCAVRNEDTGEDFEAWHVRRVDGYYPPFHGIIELMADRKLRDAHKLKNGTPLTITMYSAPGAK